MFTNDSLQKAQQGHTSKGAPSKRPEQEQRLSPGTV